MLSQHPPGPHRHPQSAVVGDDEYAVQQGGQAWVDIKAANDKANFFFIGVALLVSFVVGWVLTLLVFRCNSTRRLPTAGKVGEEGRSGDGDVEAA